MYVMKTFKTHAWNDNLERISLFLNLKPEITHSKQKYFT